MKLNRATPLAAVFFGLFLLGLAPHTAQAGNVPIGGGGSCTGQTITDPVASTQGQQQAFDDGLYTCTGTAWVPEAFIIGGVDQSNAAPSCNSTNAGMMRYTSSTLQYCNGTSWFMIPSSGSSTVPTSASTGLSTWVNQGNATETDGATGMQLLTTGVWGTSTQPMAALCKTAPATPYSIIAKVGLNGNSTQWGGMAWRNTTNGKAETLDVWNAGSSASNGYVSWTVIGFEGFALANTNAYNDTLWGAYAGDQTMWLKLKNDGTNMSEYTSVDGQSWVQLFSEALSGSYLGATGYNQICLMLVSSSGTTQIVTLMSYQETSP
jgi:hypothetical protein